MMPTHKPSDGNVFHWILEAAKAERERRQSVADYVRFRQSLVKNANAARLRAESSPARAPARASAKP